MKRALSRTLSLALLPLLGGCAASVDFNSPSPLGTGVRGKFWQAPYFVDDAFYRTVGALSGASQQALFGFEAATNGTQVQLAATWLDPNSSLYKGYGRKYTEATGWAAAGSSFGEIAADTGNLGVASVAAGPNGLFAALFFSQAGTNVFSAAYTGNAWRRYSPQAFGATIPLVSATSNLAPGPRAVTVLDNLGRGYSFYASGDPNTGHLRALNWGLGNTFGAADPATVTDVTGANVATASGQTARFDGSKQVCVTYELAAGPELRAKCLDITQGSTDFSASAGAITESIISSDVTSGHETATDGAGHVMAVFYQLSNSELHVFASLATNGVFETSATQIDTAATGYPATDVAGSRPGIAYVGSGNYLAVWVGQDSTSGTKSTQLFSALYTAGTGWGAASPIGGTFEYYSIVPHPQALHVFGNGDGNAGFALNKIYSTEAIATVAATLPDVYPEAAGGRKTQAARWQKDVGWVQLTQQGNVCYADIVNSTITDGQSSCNARPTGVILANGTTLVFFQDRDNYAGTNNDGNRRLSVLEYK